MRGQILRGRPNTLIQPMSLTPKLLMVKTPCRGCGGFCIGRQITLRSVASYYRPKCSSNDVVELQLRRRCRTRSLGAGVLAVCDLNSHSSFRFVAAQLAGSQGTASEVDKDRVSGCGSIAVRFQYTVSSLTTLSLHRPYAGGGAVTFTAVPVL
jgi:hypothetical protein